MWMCFFNQIVNSVLLSNNWSALQSFQVISGNCRNTLGCIQVGVFFVLFLFFTPKEASSIFQKKHQLRYSFVQCRIKAFRFSLQTMSAGINSSSTFVCEIQWERETYITSATTRSGCVWMLMWLNLMNVCGSTRPQTVCIHPQPPVNIRSNRDFSESTWSSLSPSCSFMLQFTRKLDLFISICVSFPWQTQHVSRPVNNPTHDPKLWDFLYLFNLLCTSCIHCCFRLKISSYYMGCCC